MQDKPQQCPALVPHRHDFTETQRKHLQPLLDKGAEIQRLIAWFMGFVAEEAGLPAAPGGYDLKFDADGKPYMVGLVPQQTAKQ